MQMSFYSPLWLLVYALWNLAAFIVVMLDKWRARRQARRIRERTLFFMAFLFGAVGVLLGMYIFRHKTRHLSFVIGVPLLLLVNLVCLYLFLRQGWLI